MEYRFLPGTGLRVSRLCLGTMTFGDQVGQEIATAMIRYGLEQGINFIDTANCYNEGASETILGKALEGCRHQVVLASKVGIKCGPKQSNYGLSRGQIIQQAEASLKRLNTDYLDIYYMHLPDYNTPIEETLDAMTCLVRSGKVRYIGASNHAAWQLCQLLYEAEKRYLLPPCVTQVVLNPLTRGVEQELVPFLGKNPMGLVTYNPLAGGLLSGKYVKHTLIEGTRFSRNPKYKERYWTEENLKAMDELDHYAQEAGISLLELSMRWSWSQPYVDSILLGFSRMGQLQQNIGSIQAGALPVHLIEACDQVWEKVSGNRFSYNR